MTEPTIGQPGAGGHKTAKMTPAQWSEAILLWKQGEMTLRALSEKFGISISRLKEKFNSVGATKGELVKRQQKAQEAALVLEESEIAKRIFDTKNEVYNHLTAIRRLVTKTVIDTVRGGGGSGRVSTVAADLKALKDAAMTIEICREGAYKLLGLDKEIDKGTALPELKIRGLDPDEIADLQAEEIDDAASLVSISQREVEEALQDTPDDDADPAD